MSYLGQHPKYTDEDLQQAYEEGRMDGYQSSERDMAERRQAIEMVTGYQQTYKEAIATANEAGRRLRIVHETLRILASGEYLGPHERHDLVNCDMGYLIPLIDEVLTVARRRID